MKKSLIILATWIIVVLATTITLYLMYKGALTEPLGGLFIVIEGAVIAELFLSKLSDIFKKPRINLMPFSKKGEIGFAVWVKDRNVEAAKVFCNYRSVNWKERGENEIIEGEEKESTTLFVGHRIWFYPFNIKIDADEISEKQQTIWLSIIEKGSNRYFYKEKISIPHGCFSIIHKPESQPMLQFQIHFIGLNIEEAIDRSLKLDGTIKISRNIESNDVGAIDLAFDFKPTQFTF